MIAGLASTQALQLQADEILGRDQIGDESSQVFKNRVVTVTYRLR